MSHSRNPPKIHNKAMDDGGGVEGAFTVPPQKGLAM